MPTALFEPSREAGLARLAAFAPKAGQAYAHGRNTDFGPGAHQAVSLLSPWLRRRMITEREVVEAVLKHHSPDAAEKFIQEVFWRTYWKGWLEMRPAVWEQYQAERAAALADLPQGYQGAIEGRTGIDGFDDWARELVHTGWLHNHARMWFASIWIFTLKLPWVLGADFFYRHLIDADPASNTLSWRWVAGLHTPGKTYLARADNIERFTNGRFRPHGLAPYAQPIIDAFTLPAPKPPRQGQARVPDGPYALLLTDDDLHPHDWPGYAQNPPRAVYLAEQGPLDDAMNTGSIASSFSKAAIEEAASRLGVQVLRFVATKDGLSGLMQQTNQTSLVVPFVLTRPSGSFLNSILVQMREESVQVHEVKRAWDDAAWPLASAGFFKLKAKIPALLGRAGLISGLAGETA